MAPRRDPLPFLRPRVDPFTWTLEECMSMVNLDQSFDRCGNCGALRSEHQYVGHPAATKRAEVCPTATWRDPGPVTQADADRINQRKAAPDEGENLDGLMAGGSQ